jgi:hypothetical protein
MLALGLKALILVAIWLMASCCIFVHSGNGVVKRRFMIRFLQLMELEDSFCLLILIVELSGCSFPI